MSAVTQAWLRARARARQTHLYPLGPSASCPACYPPFVHTGTSEDPGTQPLSTPSPAPPHTQLRYGFVAKYFIAAVPMVDHWGS